jgi:hypothetical protein
MKTEELTFEKALKMLPMFLHDGIDLLQQKTVADLRWHVQHELDLSEEGQDAALSMTLRQVNAARRFLAATKGSQ